MRVIYLDREQGDQVRKPNNQSVWTTRMLQAFNYSVLESWTRKICKLERLLALDYWRLKYNSNFTNTMHDFNTGAGAAEVSEAAAAAAGIGAGETTRRSKEELARAAEMFAGRELLDYSEDEGSGDDRREDQRSPEGVEGMEVDGEGR